MKKFLDYTEYNDNYAYWYLHHNKHHCLFIFYNIIKIVYEKCMIYYDHSIKCNAFLETFIKEI